MARCTILLTLMLAGGSAAVAATPAWEQALRELDGHVHRLSLLNLISGLNLTQEQATKLRELALQVEAVAEAPPSLEAPLPTELEGARKSYVAVGELLQAGVAVPEAVERHVTEARAAHVRFVRATLLEKPMGQGSRCSNCHTDPAASARGAAEPMALTPEVARQAEFAHCVADYGWLGLTMLVRVSPQVEALLTEAQKSLFCNFSCCLVPPHDMGDPVRAGQAESTEKEFDLSAKCGHVQRASGLPHGPMCSGVLAPLLSWSAPGATADRKAAACEAVAKAMDRARSLSDTAFEIEKGVLARTVKEAVQPSPPDSPHKAAFFLLVPGSAEVYAALLKGRGPPMNRRRFIAEMAKLGFVLQLAPAAVNAAGALDSGVHLPPAEAEYYTKNADGSVTCGLCPHHETLQDGQLGRCRVRGNVGGTLKTYGVGQPCVLNVDPIEKNPLNHVLPGASVLSIAHAGCNLRCQYCQNWQFSQESPRDTRNLKFDQAEAIGLARGKDLKAITFTYTEGTTHIEFNRRFAAAARKMGLRVFLCSNGYIQPKPLADFLEVLDGVTVTIKGFTDAFYEATIGARSVQPVLESCKAIKAAGKWLEVATLIVPGLNDSDRELGDIARWIKAELGPDTPWHLERFTPKYKLMNRPQTPVATLEKAAKLGQAAGLRFVYISNFAPHDRNHTCCPRCGKPVIRRLGFKVLANDLRGGQCPFCRTALPGIWA